MKMFLSLSGGMLNGSTRALDMMKECGALTIPKPSAPHSALGRAESEVIARGIYKVSQEADYVDRNVLHHNMVDQLSSVIRWGYRTVDSASVSYLMDKIDPQMRELCLKSLSKTLKSYSFTGYDFKRISFLASYVGVNNTKKIAICMMAAVRGGVSIDPNEEGADLMVEAWEAVPIVPDYLFCYQKPIVASMSPSTRFMLDEIVEKVTSNN